MLKNFLLLIMVDMKTYVLMISRHFMQNHPKAGKPTHFKHFILNALFEYIPSTGLIRENSNVQQKLHTIRQNHDYWARVVEKVNSGQARLSLRQWEGKPYASKQVEIARLSQVGIQKIDIKIETFKPRPIMPGEDSSTCFFNCEIQIDSKPLPGTTMRQLIENDGLEFDDFCAFFKPRFSGALIHFSDFKY